LLSILDGLGAGAIVGLVKRDGDPAAADECRASSSPSHALRRPRASSFQRGAAVYPMPYAVVVVGRGELSVDGTDRYRDGSRPLVGLGGQFVLSKKIFGRRVFPVGGNEAAALHLTGSVDRTRVAVSSFPD